MKKIITLFLSILLLSCSEKESFIYYKYEKVTITRVDKDDEVYLYYGNYESKDKLPENYVKASYAGFDGLNWGFIFFKEDKIQIMPLEGKFDIVNQTSNMEIIKNDDIDYQNWHNNKKRDYENVLEFRNVIRAEKKVNLINNSKVISVYPK